MGRWQVYEVHLQCGYIVTNAHCCHETNNTEREDQMNALYSSHTALSKLTTCMHAHVSDAD